MGRIRYVEEEHLEVAHTKIGDKAVDPNEVVTTLRNKTKNSSVTWPGGIHLSKKGSEYVMRLPCEAISHNMQTNASAFEAWALALKVCLSENSCIRIAIQWCPQDPEDKHYQRFLYRVIRFSNAMDWFVVADESQDHLNASKVLDPTGTPKSGMFVLNAPSKERMEKQAAQSARTSKWSERALEMHLKHRPELLYAAGCRGTMDRQLPVGVFKDKVKKDNSIFTGGKSAIDLWACDVDNKTVHLFELKAPGNKTVGAISELLFYSFVVHDFLAGVFTYEDNTDVNGIFAGCTDVRAYLLTAELHPLLNFPMVFDLLNKSFSASKIQYGAISYTMSNNDVDSILRKH